MKKLDYERLKSSIESQKKLVEKGEEDLKKEFADKDKYYNENKEFLNLPEDNDLAKKHKRGLEDFDNRIQFHKNTLEYRIQDAFDIADEMNKSMEPYISVTDTMANVRVSLFEQEKQKLNKEIEALNKQKDSFPEYDRTYREDGKREYENLVKEISEKNSRISEIDDEIECYKSREDLTKQYKENLKVISYMKKMAEKYMVKIPVSKEDVRKEEDKKVQEAEKRQKMEEEIKKEETELKHDEKKDEPSENKDEIKNEKNVFEKNNIINDVKEKMEQENSDYENMHLLDEEELKQVPKISGLKSKILDKIQYIEIKEKDEKVYYKDNTGKEQEISTDIGKKELFKKLKISDICKELSNSKISSMLLRRKINPNIVSALKEYPEQLKEYITSIKDKKDLPFELVHNLEGISIWKKFRLNKFAKMEEKLGAKVLGRLFDKNRTLKEGDIPEKKDTKNVMDKQKEANEVNDKAQKAMKETLENNKYARVTPEEKDLKRPGKVSMDTKYKIDNKGNIIEKVAKDKYEKISKEEQAKRAEEVKKMMSEKQNDR